MKTIAIFGGSNETTYKKVANKNGAEILFHCGKSRNGGNEKVFSTIIKKVDCVIMLTDALGHVSMDKVKEVAKREGKPFKAIKGLGASKAIREGLLLAC